MQRLVGDEDLDGGLGIIQSLKRRVHQRQDRKKRKRNEDDGDFSANECSQDSYPKKVQREPKTTGTAKSKNTTNRPSHYTTGEKVADSVIEDVHQGVYTGLVSDDLPSHIDSVEQSRQPHAEA